MNSQFWREDQMALVNCPECKALVSQSAASCPKCGFPICAESRQQASSGKKTRTGLWIVLGCLFLALVSGVAIVAIGIPFIQKKREADAQQQMERKAKVDQARVDVMQLSSAVDAYKVNYADYPPDLQTLTRPLGGRPAPLERRALLDPWGRP
jgi:hypothetical protein